MRSRVAKVFLQSDDELELLFCEDALGKIAQHFVASDGRASLYIIKVSHAVALAFDLDGLL